DPQQLGGNRIALDAAMACAQQHIRPPLQADLAGQGLADLLANAAHLGIEGIQRQQRAALLDRCKQGRGIASEIVVAHEVRTKFTRVLDAHGTATSAAATRRRSPIMMLYVRIAGPVCIVSSVTCKARNAARNSAGAIQTSVPVPTISVSMLLAAANTRASEYLWICSGRVTSQAQTPSGRHSNEPRCDIPAKAKPPLP